jgi:hypothetical protein
MPIWWKVLRETGSKRQGKKPVIYTGKAYGLKNLEGCDDERSEEVRYTARAYLHYPKCFVLTKIHPLFSPKAQT